LLRTERTGLHIAIENVQVITEACFILLIKHGSTCGGKPSGTIRKARLIGRNVSVAANDLQSGTGAHVALKRAALNTRQLNTAKTWIKESPKELTIADASSANTVGIQSTLKRWQANESFVRPVVQERQ
jgi:hypothetical protein